MTDDLDQHDPPEDDTLERRTQAIFYAALEVAGYMFERQPSGLIGTATNGEKREAVAGFEEYLRKRGYRVAVIS